MDNIKEEDQSPTMDNIGESSTRESNDIREEDTCDLISGIKVKRLSVHIVDVMKDSRIQWKTWNISDKGQKGYSAIIKEEVDSSTMDNTGESLMFDSTDIKKEDTYNYISDIKQENESPTMDNLGESFTRDSTDIKQEDTYDYISNIKQEGSSQNMDTDSEEEWVPHDMDSSGKTCLSVIKEEPDDDIKEESDDDIKEEHDEEEGTEETGNLSVK